MKHIKLFESFDESTKPGDIAIVVVSDDFIGGGTLAVFSQETANPIVSNLEYEFQLDGGHYQVFAKQIKRRSEKFALIRTDPRRSVKLITAKELEAAKTQFPGMAVFYADGKEEGEIGKVYACELINSEATDKLIYFYKNGPKGVFGDARKSLSDYFTVKI